MPLTIPSSRNEVSNRIKTDIKNKLVGSNPFLKNSFLLAISFGLSGRIYDLYKTAQNLLEELFWDTATGSFLARHASIFGISRNPATSSTGYITAYGIAGSSIPNGTQLQSSDNKTYEVQASVVIANSSVNLSSLTQSGGVATAVTPSNHGYAPGLPVTISGATETGYNGLVTILTVPSATSFTYVVDSGTTSPATGTPNIDADIATLLVKSIDTGINTSRTVGEELTFTSLIAGVEDTAFVQFGDIGGGTDIESDDDFRNRFLFRVQNPVALFNKAAIINEARKVPGVTRVWVENVDTTQGNISANTLTQTNGVGIFTTITPHGLLDGQKVSITGAVETGYNVVGKKIVVISSTVFAFATDGTPTSPATGTPIAAYSLVEEGQVKIFFVRDNDSSIIPSVSEISTTKDQILTIKPAHTSDSDVNVLAPIPSTVNFIFNSISPSNSTMEAAITANLQAFFKDKSQVGQDITLNELITAIQNTIDPENNQPLTSFSLNSPSANVTIGREELAVMGSIIF